MSGILLIICLFGGRWRSLVLMVLLLRTLARLCRLKVWLRIVVTLMMFAPRVIVRCRGRRLIVLVRWKFFLVFTKVLVLMLRLIVLFVFVGMVLRRL